MQITYLEKFKKYADNKIAYIPLGTIEWHGEHLPIETDFLIAKKICELLSKKNKGYILPPFYLGTDRSKVINGVKFAGMDMHFQKRLQGSLYYIEPELLEKVLEALINNLIKQGFNKINLITGHAGSAHRRVLEKLNNKFVEVIYTNPYEGIGESAALHADENETSLFWALYPEEEKRCKKREIDKDNDCYKFIGHDIVKKSSQKLGKKILEKIIANFEIIGN